MSHHIFVIIITFIPLVTQTPCFVFISNLALGAEAYSMFNFLSDKYTLCRIKIAIIRYCRFPIWTYIYYAFANHEVYSPFTAVMIPFYIMDFMWHKKLIEKINILEKKKQDQ